MTNFTAQNRLGELRDPQRDFIFELIISDTELKTVTGKTAHMLDSGGFTVRCKTSTIPSRGTDSIDVFFAGLKAVFPGRPTFGDNSFSVQLDETEDQLVFNTGYAWRERIFSVDPDGASPGYSSSINKAGLTANPILRMYTYNGVPMPTDIVFKNAWLADVGQVELSMQGNGKVTYNWTFKFDYWVASKSKTTVA